MTPDTSNDIERLQASADYWRGQAEAYRNMAERLLNFQQEMLAYQQKAKKATPAQTEEK